MASHEIKAQQDTNATNSGVAVAGKTPLISQTPQKADAAKSEAKSKETFQQYMERKFRDLGEEKRRLEETTTKKMQIKKTAEENRSADTGPNSSQQTVSKPRTATTSRKSLTNHARTLNKKQSKPASGKFWDGFITENPPFPLTEIIALKPSSSFANFYAFARRNGRTGMIKTDLIQDILNNSPRVPLDDAEMMLSAVQPQPKTYKDHITVEMKESKSRGSTAIRQCAADNNSATEYQITRQTFDQVCDELKTYIEDMDTGSSAESKVQQTRLCIEALTTMSEKAKELHENSRAQQDNTEAAVAAPSLSPMPSSIDWKINKTYPKKNPTFPVLEVESLTDLKFGDFEGARGKIDPKDRGLKQLWQEWKKGTRELANDDDQGPMSYSEAAKAAVRYYTLTSAYGKSV